MIKVFYDGKCGLCSKEINHYKNIAPENIFEWIDITEISEENLNKEDLDTLSCMKLFHVKDNEGKFHTGVDAFIIIWSQLNKWRKLATIIKLPLIYSFAKIIYSLFAKWRFNCLTHCKIK
ncbi:thiol-disulfide oxidoreductase DCC family protein [Francisella philomiragia]|uniref:thiol-disulfide oxidoreductase DCC family protein n=1 Tax=Francisella philomiragia TaxID=28110 RepID=UPI003519BC65